MNDISLLKDEFSPQTTVYLFQASAEADNKTRWLTIYDASWCTESFIAFQVNVSVVQHSLVPQFKLAVIF